jgi:alpha-D-ribose 1-methylphosphonate 5-triphosphate diphosphatase
LISKQQKYAADNRQAIVSLCHERNIPIASHDDTISEHIEQAVLEQIAISEFPTTKLAASLARKAGLNIVMGGPNVVRGGSHSGNVAAQDLAAEGLLDILSSDYVPGSLASGAFMLHKKLSIPLHETICMVSLNPAQAVGLFDRGEIYPGKRSDMLRVREVEDVPVVLQTWAVGVGDLLDIARKNAA